MEIIALELWIESFCLEVFEQIYIFFIVQYFICFFRNIFSIRYIAPDVCEELSCFT